METSNSIKAMAQKGGSFDWRVPAEWEENLSTTAREISVSKVISQGGVRAGAILQGAVLPEVLHNVFWG